MGFIVYIVCDTKVGIYFYIASDILIFLHNFFFPAPKNRIFA